ncbi:ROK family protein [Micromonospora sp. DR5-3]|uniref:ROK family protein n=1 Tax=unclassified Micromonospora TaxID=2617518 RepID=UPI0011D7DBB8|nr:MULTISPECIES: ROK family protein [unclassified Micromonospora]MCW3815982.1 ROK family protein [Micromonospora sp. DR5-3]TYC15719.1 ROK family protein [Micromonospora sp. MP36]
MSGFRDVVAAIDVGGTRIKAALVDRSYQQLTRITHQTPPDIATDIGSVASQIVSALLDQARTEGEEPKLVGCGMVVPGVVDERRGIGRLSVNLGWRDLPVAEQVRRAVRTPAMVGHDVRAGLLAESRLGAARGARNVAFLPVGTGVAGALMLDGRLVAADGWAGELGHVVVDPAGSVCGCGGRGCLETVGSAAAVEQAYARDTGQRVGAETVAGRAAAGEPAAAAVWARAVDALARAIATTVGVTGVDLVLIGGGLAESGELLLAPLRRAVDDRLTFHRRPRLQRAALGDRAGCLGAACLAWDAL